MTSPPNKPPRRSSRPIAVRSPGRASPVETDSPPASARPASLSRGRLVLVGAVAGILTLGGLAGVFTLANRVFFPRDAEESAPVADEQTVPAVAASVISEEDPPEQDAAPASVDSSTSIPEEGPVATTEGVASATTGEAPAVPNATPDGAAASTESSPANEPQAPVLPLPLADVIDVRHEHLPLPSTEQDRSHPGGGGLAEAAQLAKVYVDDVQHVHLDLVGEELILAPGIQFAVEEEVSPDNTTKIWKVSEPNPTGLVKTGIPIGEFRLHDRQLSFAWAQNVRSANLKYCQLVINAQNATGTQTARCSLTDPIEQSPLRLNFDRTKDQSVLNLDPGSLPDTEHLRVDLNVRGWEASKFTLARNTLRLVSSKDSDDKSTIEFRDPQGDGTPADPIVHVEIRVMQRGGDQPEFYVTNFVYQPEVRFVGKGTAQVPPGVEFGPSDQPSEFARISQRDANRQNSKLKAELKKALRALQGLIKIKTQELNAVGSLTEKQLPKYKKDRRVQELQDELKTAYGLQDDYKAAAVFVNECEDWPRHLKDVYQHLEEEVEIDFRLYFTVGGKEIDILRSRAENGSADRAAEGEDSGTPEVGSQEETTGDGT